MARRLETLFDRYRRRGDAAALGKVFDRTAPEILRVAMHLARHPAEAEDLLQETFLTAISRAGSYDAARPLVPWLLGILKNHARAHRRKRLPVSGAVEEGVSPREPWMDVAWGEDVAKEVEALPDPYREVLVLLLRHERAPAEIAILLDRPPATVRSQIHRGLERLRRKLPQEERSAGLAAFPIGVGLDAIRTRVMTEAAATATVAAGTTVTSGTLLLLGGLAMTKKSVWTSAVLVAAALLGVALWPGGLLDRDGAEDEPAEHAEARTHADGAGDESEGRPVLVGSPSAVAPSKASGDEAEPTAVAARVWPPDDTIPEDKGSVAGTIRFEDGTPLVGTRVALWGSSKLFSVTDEQGRYHIHADWVHDRSVFIRLGPPDTPDWVGIILSTGVDMKAGELVMRDVTIERGVDLEGVVVDDRTDEPLEGVKVTLRHHARYEGQASSGFLHTDAAGRFRFPYVPPDAYTLELVAEGYEGCVRDFDLTKGPFPDRWPVTTARRLVLRFENLPEGAVGSEVSVDLNRMDASNFSVMKDHTIQPDGTVTVDAPQPGRYRLTIFKSDHVPRVEQTIEIEADALEPIVVALPGGARVEGTIRDAEGRPIAKARVSIGKAAGRPKTDADGHFAFERVKAGTRTVWVEVEDAWIRFGVVEVPGGGEVRAELAAPGLSRLEGTFHVGGTPVVWHESELKVKRAGTEETVATVRVGGHGRFVLSMLPAGRYDVLAWSSRGIPELREVVLHRAETVSLGVIDLAPYLRTPVTLVFPAGGEAPGRVWVQAYDAAYPSARMPSSVPVGRTKYMVSPHVKTEDDGRTWVEGLLPGRVRLEFRCDGYEPAVVEVDVGPDAKEPVRVEFVAKR